MLKQRYSFYLSLLFCLFTLTVQAQTAQKPSVFTERRQVNNITRPVQTIDDAAYLEKITDLSEFDRMARVFYLGSSFEIPHAIFLIDLQQDQKIYYINSRRYRLHEDFIRERKLLVNPTREQLNFNYESDQRRFILGTLSWQQNLSTWTYEFWEGDTINAALLEQARARLQDTFFAPVQFKTNSTAQQSVADQAGIAAITQESLISQQPFLPLNVGKAVGRLRIVSQVDSLNDIAPDDILVLQEVPLSIPPVAGVITDRPSTTLSHVNLLAKTWGVPNAYVRDAAQVLAQYDGKWVALEVNNRTYKVTPTSKVVKAVRKPLAIAQPVLRAKALMPIRTLQAENSQDCGNKATNLGIIANAIQKGKVTGVAPVPDGFCIPFSNYVKFIQTPAAVAQIKATESTPGFQKDRQVRKQALQALQAALIELPMDEQTAKAIQAQWSVQLNGKGVFARSTSNAEDLPNFSGAGLFTSVPNVTDADSLITAVKTVWASVYNLEAYEARQQAQIPSDKIVMGVLVQVAVDAQSAGVMATLDPFDPGRYSATYISAKRGLGIRVVEGVRQAEQVIYVKWSNAIQVLSRSQDDVSLELDKNGGVKEVSVEAGLEVLNDDLIRGLAEAGLQIKKLFNGVEQDIEWAVDKKGKIVILQARRYGAMPH